MHNEGVSEILYKTIQKLMKHELFDDFLLGGGTNLAIKYNHRISTDIDLFAPKVVGTAHLEKIYVYLNEEFKGSAEVVKDNFESENLAFLSVFLIKENIKLDIIQNLKLNKPHEEIDGIRFINEIDIGALKLLAAADRGHQKDFYDLVLLCSKNSLGIYFDNLLEIQAKYSDGDENIFSIQESKPKVSLHKDLSALSNFNNAGDKKEAGNRILLTETSPVNENWPTLRDKWVKEVQKLAENRSIKFKRVSTKRTRGIKFFR